jgi:hypothetical protein
VQLTALARFWRLQAGRLLDAAVFAWGSYAAFFAPKEGTPPLDYVFRSRWVGAVMLAAWAAQGAGAWLKRVPLQARLAERPGVSSPLEAAQTQIFILGGWHAIISGILFFAGVTNLVPELRVLDDNPPSWGLVLLILLAVAVCLVPTVLVWRATRPPAASEPVAAWRRGPLAEFAADQLLAFSYLVLALTVFGNPAMLQGTRPLSPSTFLGWAAALLLVVPLLWLVLTWVFVPFRMLLIFEELGTWRSRLSFLVSMSPLISRYIVG